MPYQERTARIFISSTFRDMHGERDALIRRVFPELQERCRALNVRVLALDLRWGVTKEEAENGKALEICLDEIDRSRPFFVGLLGERYGWVPDAYETSDQAKFDWLKALPPKEHSITALEVIHGVLNNPAQVPHSYFYFRDPAFLADLPAETKPDFEAESPESAQKLQVLKDRIWATYRDRPENVQTYPCRIQDGVVAGLEEFERLVMEDLWTDIQAQFPLEEDTRSPLRIERDRHEAFMVEAFRSFVGRDAILARLREWIDEEVELARPLILIGAGGSGKSAALAKLALTERERRPDTLVLSAFVGITQESRDIMALHKRLIAELDEAAGLGLTVPDSMDGLKDTLAVALNRASAHRPVLVLIDAADQLADIHQAPALTWLPPFNPGKVRILVSGLSGSAPDEAASIRSLPRLALEPFGAVHARAAVSSLLAEYRKELHRDSENRDQMALLLAKTDAGLPLYLQAAAHELRVHPRFETLTEKILALPDDLPGLFAHIFERLERDHGRPLVEAALCLLELSGVGLTESELIELLSAALQAPLAPARWAALRRNLEDLVRGGESAESRYQPYHRVVREAIHTRYLTEAAIESVWYGLLAEAGIDSWSPDQAPSALTARMVWNLLKAGRIEQAADQALAVLETDEKAWKTQRILLDTASRLLGEDAGIPLDDWFAQVTTRILSAGDAARNRWHEWLIIQGVAYIEQARSGLGRGFYEAALQALGQALAQDPNNTGYQQDLSISYNNLGNVALSQSAAAEAKAHYEKSIEIRQKLVTQNPDNAEYQHDLSTSYGFFGRLAQSQGGVAEAKRYFERSLEILQELATLDPDNADYQRDLSTNYGFLGSLAEAQGDATGAKRYYEKWLKMIQKLVILDPDNAVYQRDLSTNYGFLGSLAKSQGDAAEAKGYFEKSLAIRQKLVAMDPDNAKYRRDLTVDYGYLGSLAESQGEAAEAKRYYQKNLEVMKKLVAQDPANAGYQRDLSVGYSYLGSLAEAQGDKAGAKGNYEQFLETIQTLVARDTANPSHQLDLSVSYDHLGRLAQSQGDAAGARLYFEKSLEIRQTLVALDPENAEYQRDLSSSYSYLGSLAKSQADAAGAKHYYEKSLEMRQELVSLDLGNAEYQQDLSTSYNDLGSLAESQGDAAGAKFYYEKSLEMCQKLVALDLTNADYQSGLSVSYLKLGSIALIQGEALVAKRYYEASLEMMHKLAALDTAKVGYQRALSVGYSNLGRLTESQGDTEGAKQYYEKDLEVMKKLVALDPANAGYQHELSVSYKTLGNLTQSQGKAAEAKTYYDEELGVMQKLANLDTVNASYLRDLSVSYSNLGSLAQSQGDALGAKQYYEKDLEVIKKLVALDPANAEYQHNRSVSYNNLGSLAQSQGDTVGAKGYYEKALEISEKLVALYPANAGYRMDLAISYWNHFRVSPQEEALPWLQKARAILDEMHAQNQRHRQWQELSDLVAQALRSEPQ